MKIIVIPDIHGQYTRLNDLFNKLKYNHDLNEYLIIFLGDYIDRGTENKKVIEYLVKLNTEYKCEFLLGNHDNLLLESINNYNHECFLDWINNNGLTTASEYLGEKQASLTLYSIPDGGLWDSYSKTYNVKLFSHKFKKVFPIEHLNFFNNLKLYYETDKYFFVHAGVNLDKPINENTKDDFIWIRPPFFINDKPKYPLNKLIIHGHTPVKFLENSTINIGIDFKAFDKNRMLIAYSPETHSILEFSDII